MMRTRALGLIAMVLLASACKKDDPTLPVPVESPEPTQEASDGLAPAPPIQDSAAVRDALVAAANANLSEEPGDDGSFGAISAWAEAYSDLSFTGYAIPPDEGSVPVYANLMDSKDVAADGNPYVVAFAVLGADGVCAGGLATGYPAPAAFEPVDFAGEEQVCDPMTVAAVGGYPLA